MLLQFRQYSNKQNFVPFSYISHYFRTPAEADAPNKRPTHRLHDFLMKAIGKLLQKFVSPEQRKVKIDLCL